MNAQNGPSMDELIKLAKMKMENPDEYRTTMAAIKEVTKDIAKMSIDILKEMRNQL
jgi:hypothetical protein